MEASASLTAVMKVTVELWSMRTFSGPACGFMRRFASMVESSKDCMVIRQRTGGGLGPPPQSPPGGPPPPMQPMMPMAPERRITSGAIIAIVGGLLGLIGFFLPWYNISGSGGAAPPSWGGAALRLFGG